MESDPLIPGLDVGLLDDGGDVEDGDHGNDFFVGIVV